MITAGRKPRVLLARGFRTPRRKHGIPDHHHWHCRTADASARLANPLDPMAKAMKAVSSKRTKTDEDYEKLARLEHAGGLYIDPDVGPFIPGENIQRCLIDAAKVTRAGVKVTRGVFISTDVNPLGYQGPRDVDGLWADENFRHMKSVKVQTNRVMRCRPRFRQWTVEADGTLDTALLSLEEFKDIADTAGSMIGLGDYRPRFGRFTAQVVKL
ncbi:hypothetical protein OG819_42590 [Streptomyces sp. NBC_01549]|uniref:hypothetical protein n=1 Tax=Streptomyces sp. NBC_01549 TaxID=2975874 RepID=UPI002250401C|nr:hypothetical protein [Streptomyces sp. NBC_01549]MCX4596105.1 hypothetical protein [Streptomyces sp. NBC_01549]